MLSILHQGNKLAVQKKKKKHVRSLDWKLKCLLHSLCFHQCFVGGFQQLRGGKLLVSGGGNREHICYKNTRRQ